MISYGSKLFSSSIHPPPQKHHTLIKNQLLALELLFDEVWKGRSAEKGWPKGDTFFKADNVAHELKRGDFLDDFAGALKSSAFAEGFNDLEDGVDFGFDLDPVILVHLAQIQPFFLGQGKGIVHENMEFITKGTNDWP